VAAELKRVGEHGFGGNCLVTIVSLWHIVNNDVDAPELSRRHLCNMKCEVDSPGKDSRSLAEP
jgi:hypothetical protein